MMAKNPRYKALLGTVLALCFCACQGRGCGKREKLGRLIEISGGVVQRDEATPPESWEQVELGQDFAAGDGLRTNAQSAAIVQLSDGSQLLIKPQSVVRFRTAQGGSEPEVEVVSGEAVIQAGDKAVQLHTHVGVALLKAGAKVQLTRAANGLRVHLEVGDAMFRTLDGTELKLSKTEDLRLEIGAAVIREPPSAARASAEPSADRALQLEVTRPEVQARARGETSAKGLSAGKLSLRPDTELLLSTSGNATLIRERDRVDLTGGEYHVEGGERLLSARRGKLRMHAESRDVHIAVPGGWIVARAANGGSDAEIDLSDKEGQLQVSRGEVSWHRGNLHKQVTPGQPLRWQLAAADAGPLPGDAGPSFAESPERASLSVKAGETFVLHAPELPVALELRTEQSCDGALVVELNGGARFRGDGTHVKLRLDDKARNYNLRCQGADGRLGKPLARANVRVLHDAGTRNLPPRAPTSLVDADGRGYTIYYQNQPPDVRVRWPSAPQAGNYQLDVDGKALALNAPEHTFDSGGLRDGVHRLTFSAKDRRSRTTTVEVRFDNTATTASLSAPIDRSFSPGATVDIEGVLLPAWKVSVDGGMIEKIGEDRFHGRIVTTPQNPDFAVRLFHPRLGTHYYLRRAAGAP